MAEIKANSPLTWLADPFRPTGSDSDATYRFSGGSAWWLAPLAIGLVLLVVTAIGGGADRQQFFFSYLVGWVYCLTVALGALFFVLIQHLTKASWSVVVRRIPEALLWTFPLLAILSFPIIYGMHDLYHWTHHELFDPSSPAYDEVIAGKAAYLNVSFFLVRLLFYFSVWTLVAYRLYSLSLKQDLTGDPTIPARMRKVSAWGLPLFAITTAFSGIDLLMSLDPHWFSTMFGVYFFAGCFVSALALITFVTLLVQGPGGMLKGVITAEHHQDLGKLLFGFTVFWTYIAFSQYMLIWYGNLPEETVWFRHRLEHGWEYHSAALLAMHFIIPFIVLISRGAKRTPAILGFMAVWMLVMHWFDLHWIAMPVLTTAREGHAGFSWLDFTCWLGLFGVFFGLFMYRLSRHSIVPAQDPNLDKSMKFMNS
ncbi:MAG: hypothetical protein R2834_19205 [Rhodothermales bacterium]